LTGIKKLIDLGDQSYGEWIVYDRTIPKYHINIFEKDDSNALVHELISNKTETIESIIKKVNVRQGTSLTIGGQSFFEILKKEESVDLELAPLPINWIKNIS